jgi:glycogen operon protein
MSLPGITALISRSVSLTRPAPETKLTVSRGSCMPLGAHVAHGGVNFALFARHAERVHLVLFKEGEEERFHEIPLEPETHRTGDVWHVFVQGLPAGTLYGYRVYGPSNPRAGHHFDGNTIVIDPYARAISGGEIWGVPNGPPDGTSGYPRARGRVVRRGKIVSDNFDWDGDVPPRTPLAQSIIYEVHVRGFTRHPSADVAHPGTYRGLCEKLPYLKSLGVTAVQLMPVLEFDEFDTIHRNPATGEVLLNFWGYSPLSFFAPKASYASSPADAVREFKQMVKAFHREGIEVILDVVYNHTCEGNECGPTISYRGIDNAVYYLLDREGRYFNYSGCGNTFNCNHPVVHQHILDSLVYLVSELHVDGFRFDLASILGRGTHGEMLEDPPLLRHISENPVLSDVKLLAEPWDAAGSSHLGKFPGWGRWAELNGAFRDDVRKFVRGDTQATACLAKRICGSLDMYPDSPHHPGRSVNFVTCHDGFTLADLVSYCHKRNHPNGEHNRDGWNHNFSCNGGIEGPTDNAQILTHRQRQMRNFLAMLFASQGVPLLLQGDEFGRTQQGNNNAYAQDNEISWINWELAAKNAPLLRFTRMLIALRKRHFLLNPGEFAKRVSWHGTTLGDPDWSGTSRALAFHLHGQPDFYFLFNMHHESQRFHLPGHHGQWRWRRLVDTNLVSPHDIVEEKDAVWLNPGDHYIAAPHSTVILTQG